MKKFWVVLVALLCPVLAWGADGYSGETLRKRLEDELLRDGISLTKLEQRLVVAETAPAHWQVTLFDTRSGKPVDAQEVTGLPKSLDAAVAQLLVTVAPMVRGQSATQSDSERRQAAVGEALTLMGEKSRGNKDAIDQYEKRAIGFDDWVGVNTQNGAVVASWTMPFKGKYKEPLAGADFYDYVGRKDLAETYRTRSVIRWSLYGAGLLGTLGGSWLVIQSITDSGDLSPTLGYVAMGVGGASLLAAMFVNPHAVTAPEARQLADNFNSDLRHELGIEESASTSSPAAEPTGVSFAGAPWVSPTGAGLALGMRF